MSNQFAALDFDSSDDEKPKKAEKKEKKQQAVAPVTAAATGDKSKVKKDTASKPKQDAAPKQTKQDAPKQDKPAAQGDALVVSSKKENTHKKSERDRKPNDPEKPRKPRKQIGGVTIPSNIAVDDLIKINGFLANTNGEQDTLDAEAETPVADEPEEPELPPQFTLEEYEAQKAAAAAAVQGDIKKREVKPINDLKARKRDDDADFIKLAQGVEKNNTKKDQRSTTKVAAEIGFQTGPIVDPEREAAREERTERPRGGRGRGGDSKGREGRGRGSEGRGGRGGRSPRPSTGGAKFDPSDFPSL